MRLRASRFFLHSPLCSEPRGTVCLVRSSVSPRKVAPPILTDGNRPKGYRSLRIYSPSADTRSDGSRVESRAAEDDASEPIINNRRNLVFMGESKARRRSGTPCLAILHSPPRFLDVVSHGVPDVPDSTLDTCLQCDQLQWDRHRGILRFCAAARSDHQPAARRRPMVRPRPWWQ